ncbi:unnamed protein product, partial [Staurois parvus]
DNSGSGSGYLSNSGTCLQSLVISFTVCSLWSSPVRSAVSSHPLHCPQSLVFCTVSAVSGLLYCVRSLWSSVLCPQSLVFCTVSAVSGH